MLKTFKVGVPLLIAMLSVLSCGGRVPSKPLEPISPSQKPDPLPSVAPQPSQAPSNGKFVDLKVLSLNCWGVPRIVIYDPTKDQKERFTNIATVVNGYDIVNLQETFSDNSDIIISGANYPTKVRYNNTSFGSYGSGLTTFTKYNIVKKGFKKFSQCASSDCFSNKGVFFMRLNIPQVGDVDLYNTHYQAIDEQEEIRLGDNKEFADFIKQNEAGNPTIITGDFNYPNYDVTDKTSKALLDLKKRLNPIDTFRVANPDAPGFTNDPTINPYGDKNDKPERLDYIFILPENRGVTTNKLNYKIDVLESKIMFNQPVNGKFLSDHFGLTTTFRINIL